MMKATFIQLAAVIVSVVLILTIGVGIRLFMPIPVAEDALPQTIRISPGATFSWVCDQLADRGIVRHRWDLEMLARIVGLDKRMPAGAVTLEPGLSLWEVVWRLMQTEALTVNVTIPEGLPARQIAAIFQQQGVVDSVIFMKAVANPRLIENLGLETPDLEGFLFPDTYNFFYSTPADAVIRRMVNRFQEVWDDSLSARASKLEWTVRQAVTLASIIEGEVMVPSEAPVVSSVYHNRLKAGMYLQADPTIQYIIPDGPRRLLNEDLQIESPYNTYLHKGLPPGPICNPGRNAILAALYPADAKYMYFVAKGDGTHAFNETEEGHWKDKWKFQKVRREVARKNK